MSILTLSQVSYTYKGAARPAVADVSCDFSKGVLYAVVGPSGSGKSTLLSLLLGLDFPTGGSVLYDGDDTTKLDMDRYRRENVAIIFQQFHLFPLLTAVENVCFPMELRGIPQKNAKPRAKELLESVGIIGDQIKRYPSQLSGGEQQRVAIARCLSAGSQVILADEPTGNLDIENTENIMEMLRKLAHDEKCCVIVVTHDRDVAAVADVVYKMTDGALVLEEEKEG